MECFWSTSGVLWRTFGEPLECFWSASGVLLNAFAVLLEQFCSALGVVFIRWTIDQWIRIIIFGGKSAADDHIR